MSSPSNELYSFFNEFRLQEKFSDIVVKVQGRSFACHRIILASALKYFRDILFSATECDREANEKNNKEVELKGINADDFELVLAHIYGAPVSFNEKNVFRLLKLSHYLCLPNLEDMCLRYIAESADTIRLHNAVCIFVFASNIGKCELVERLTKRMAAKFASVSKYRVFERISAACLLTILDHPALDKEDPTVVLDFVAKWMKFQSEEGKSMVPDLLSTVQLDKVPKEWFVKALTLMTRQPTSSNVSECEDQRSEDYYENESVSDLGGQSPPPTPEVFDDEVDGAIMAMTFPTATSIAEKAAADVNEALDEDDNSISRLHVPFLMYTLDAVEGRPSYEPVNVYQFTSPSTVSLLETTNLDDIYENSSFCKSVFVDSLQYLMNFYLPPKSSSLHVSCRPHMSHEFVQFNHFSRKSYERSIGCIDVPGVTAIGNAIYVYNNGTFHLFDCATSKWSEATTTVVDQNNFVTTVSPNLASHGSSLFLIGGESISDYAANHDTNSKLFQHYDIREGKWSQLPPMMNARSHSAACLDADDVLYVSGGANLAYQKPSIERFDFKAGRWERIATMPRPKMNHTFFAYKNRLWFFGGKKYYSNHYSADKLVSWHHDTCGDLTWYSYDLKDAAWSDVSSMRTDDDNNFYTKKIVDVILPINNT